MTAATALDNISFNGYLKRIIDILRHVELSDKILIDKRIYVMAEALKRNFKKYFDGSFQILAQVF